MKKNNIMRRRSLLLGLFLLACTLSGVANAAISNFTPGWPRFVIKNMTTQNSGTAAGAASSLATANGINLIGANSSVFVSNSTQKITWQEETGLPQTLLNSSAFVWAEIDTTTNAVLQGRIDIFGDVLGFNGLQFGADLSRLVWKTDKLGFAQINHSGNVCDLGFCTNVEELLYFKDLIFNGDFSQAFVQNAKVISTVPVPAAAWLFISGIMGLFGFSRKRAS